MKMNGKTLYYHYNVHGDVVALTDEAGKIVAEYGYDAWGNVLKNTASTEEAQANPYGYAGYTYDKEIGQYYLMARYYDPEQGVFTAIDPYPGNADAPQMMNGYNYANNNPVMLVDSDGLWAGAAIRVGIKGAKYAWKYGKKGAKWVGKTAKKVWKKVPYRIKGPSSRDGRIFAIVNKNKTKKKGTLKKGEDGRLFSLDYHAIREKKKRSTRKVLHFHWGYKKNKHHIIYPKRKKIKWK
ncbi:RHS repeat-associated core domain-containing protein [Listeria seeligeri]|nr:RHS repeat-associated core domain-containing protein [Listeria seeligeri]MBC1555979.1 RHS repeat-associated core domain-containing protein [Listeria seeligeri]MBC6123394.1 RHS repeat-associated core domain-containing protein [Listeria seeligeri]MBF2458922.1 RHS repeat-associated core domain-containing protein [Listeria seeligeri]MBF2549157.1 RHS repeat-associated core domain-containing protein [Listeria seeligeri]